MYAKKIGFIGDSITEGIPGVNFVDKIYLKDCYLSNMGKGGDTIRSINKRMKKLNLESFDSLVFFVGINEVFSQLNFTHKVFKVLMQQSPEKDLNVFRSRYNDALDYLLTKTKKVIVVTPAILGENTTNHWNKLVKEYVDIIKDIAVNRDLICIDINKVFTDFLKDKKQSDYIPKELMTLRNDTLVKEPLEIDKISKERGLHLTLDGVHLNSAGATLVSQAIGKVL